MTAEQSHDITVAEDLIENLKPENILADTAYDSNKFHEKVTSLGAEACIKPSRHLKAVIKRVIRWNAFSKIKTESKNLHSL